MATRALLAELTLTYARLTGGAVDMEAMSGVDAARRVRTGERLDLVVLAGDVVDALAAEGHLAPGERVDLAVSAVAMAARHGDLHPDISDAGAVRTALLQANAIGYSTGPSGEHLLKPIARWDLGEALAPKLRRVPPGVPVASLIARGEADLGVQQLSELKDRPGVTVLGILPKGIGALTTFSAATGSRSRAVEAARAVLAYLASPSTAEAKRRHGMEPAA